MKPILIPWTYWDFVYLNGKNDIADWHRELSDDAKNLLQNILKTNKKTEIPINWMNFKRYLSGAARNERIWELWFKADGLQHRLLGIFGREEKNAIFLMGCYHKMRVYTPANAIETAIKRSKLFRAGEANLHERKIRLDI